MTKKIKTDKTRMELAELIDDMWGILCNVSGGDWTKQSREWQKAVLRIRPRFFKLLNKI